MPEPSETMVTASTSSSTRMYMGLPSGDSGLPIVAVCVESRRLPDDTWIVTTTTPQGYPEVWHVLATKAVTPSCPAI